MPFNGPINNRKPQKFSFDSIGSGTAPKISRIRKYRSKLILAVTKREPPEVIDKIVEEIRAMKLGNYVDDHVLQILNNIEKRKKEMGIKD